LKTRAQKITVGASFEERPAEAAQRRVPSAERTVGVFVSRTLAMISMKNLIRANDAKENICLTLRSVEFIFEQLIKPPILETR
jgi:hypothetical protein